MLHIVWWMMMMFGQRRDPSITFKLRPPAAGQASVAYGYQRQVVTPKPTGQLSWRQTAQLVTTVPHLLLFLVTPDGVSLGAATSLRVLRVVYIKKYQCAWLIYELFAWAHLLHVVCVAECMPCGSATSKVASEALLVSDQPSAPLLLSVVWLATSDFACDVVTVQCRFNRAYTGSHNLVSLDECAINSHLKHKQNQLQLQVAFSFEHFPLKLCKVFNFPAFSLCVFRLFITPSAFASASAFEFCAFGSRVSPIVLAAFRLANEPGTKHIII